MPVTCLSVGVSLILLQDQGAVGSLFLKENQNIFSLKHSGYNWLK